MPLLAQFGSQVVTAVITLVTAYLGFRWSARNDERKDSRTAQRERELREAEAARRLEEDRHRQQLEALMTLQDDVHAFGRAAFRILHFDIMKIDAGADGSIHSGLEEIERQIRSQISVHVSRVLDPAIRDSVADLLGMAEEVSARVVFDLTELTDPTARAQMARQSVQECSAAFERTRRSLDDAVRSELSWQPSRPLNYPAKSSAGPSSSSRPGPR